MEITYDKDVDALYIEINMKKAVESEEIEKDIIIEVLNFIKENKNNILPAIKEIEKVVA